MLIKYCIFFQTKLVFQGKGCIKYVQKSDAAKGGGANADIGRQRERGRPSKSELFCATKFFVGKFCASKRAQKTFKKLRK